MICNKCNNPGVLNTVLDKSFYYCQTCKEEIELEPVLDNVGGAEEFMFVPDISDLTSQDLADFDMIMGLFDDIQDDDWKDED